VAYPNHGHVCVVKPIERKGIDMINDEELTEVITVLTRAVVLLVGREHRRAEDKLKEACCDVHAERRYNAIDNMMCDLRRLQYKIGD